VALVLHPKGRRILWELQRQRKVAFNQAEDIRNYSDRESSAEFKGQRMSNQYPRSCSHLIFPFLYSLLFHYTSTVLQATSKQPPSWSLVSFSQS
jgi:hypothetical protein